MKKSRELNYIFEKLESKYLFSLKDFKFKNKNNVYLKHLISDVENYKEDLKILICKYLPELKEKFNDYDERSFSWEFYINLVKDLMGLKEYDEQILFFIVTKMKRLLNIKDGIEFFSLFNQKQSDLICINEKEFEAKKNLKTLRGLKDSIKNKNVKI